MTEWKANTVELPLAIAEKLRNCKTLPTLPAAALKIIEVAQLPEIDMSIVAKSVSSDPSIAAKVMRIANSPLYSRRRRATNLRQALITLGLNATLTLALSFTLVKELQEKPAKGFDFHAFWKRSLLAGSWARMLAAEKNLVGGEEMFLVALLQDIGMMAIDRIAPEVYANISPFEMNHDELTEHEVQFLGTDHTRIGGWLLQDWNMPEALSLAVMHSHDPDAGDVDGDMQDLVRVTALSGYLADTCLSGAPLTPANVAPMVCEHIALSPERLVAIYDGLVDEIPEAEFVFATALMSSEEIDAVMDAARETLLIRNLNVFSEAAELVERAESLQNENKALKHENRRDELTCAFNRRHFEDTLNEEFAVAQEFDSPLSMIFVDIDLFKQANDTYGHVAGDEVLKAVANLLFATVRDTDVVARYGGDEFVVILPGVALKPTAQVAARLVEGARSLRIRAENGDVIKVTLSLGTATHDAANRFKSAAGLIRAADEALYDSKRRGRNCHTDYRAIAAA